MSARLQWGYDYRGIWVDRGRRAQFQFGYDNNNNMEAEDTQEPPLLPASWARSLLAPSSPHKTMTTTATIATTAPTNSAETTISDGYRSGQRDWDDDLDPYYQRYRNRYNPQFQTTLPRATTTAITIGLTGTADS